MGAAPVWLVAALGVLLVLKRIPPGLAQETCSPVSTGPTGAIAVEHRLEDVLRTAVSPVNFGVRSRWEVVHARDGDPMSVVLADLLRQTDVEGHACLRGDFNNSCGLSPSHPANSGQFIYTFSDPDINLEGHSVQTLIGGVCLDNACQTMTPVALHNGSCTYTADVNGTTLSVSSLATALSTVERVTWSSMDAASGAASVSSYGLVQRNDMRVWKAEGYRQIVPGVPSHSALCNMSQWHANSSEARVEDNILYGCSGVEEALYEKPIRSWPGTMTREGARYLHVQDLDSAAGEVGKQCKSLGKVLLQAASAIASSQDTVASGLHDGAFLATKPQLKSVSEVWLSIVTAVQGVTVAFLLLFVGADARVRHILDWKRHVTARVRGLPRPPPVRAEDLSERKLACLRLALLLLTLFVSWVEFLPLVVTLYRETKSRNWVGTFVHVDLVTIMPGSTPGATVDDSPTLLCSAGVPFVVIPLLGRARLLSTSFDKLVSAMVILTAVEVGLLVLRLWTWKRPVRAPPSPGASPTLKEVDELGPIVVSPLVAVASGDTSTSGVAAIVLGSPPASLDNVPPGGSPAESPTQLLSSCAHSCRVPKSSSSALRKRTTP